MILHIARRLHHIDTTLWSLGTMVLLNSSIFIFDSRFCLAFLSTCSPSGHSVLSSILWCLPVGHFFGRCETMRVLKFLQLQNNTESEKNIQIQMCNAVQTKIQLRKWSSQASTKWPISSICLPLINAISA